MVAALAVFMSGFGQNVKAMLGGKIEGEKNNMKKKTIHSQGQ